MAPKPAHAVWWILGILGGVFVLIVLAGLTTAELILRHIDVRSDSKRVEIQMPVGDFEVSKDGTHATGLPLYPGATKGTDENIVGGSADISVGDEALESQRSPTTRPIRWRPLKRGIAATSRRVFTSRLARTSA